MCVGCGLNYLARQMVHFVVNRGGGVGVGPFLYLSAPFLANVSVILLLVIHVCAHTFCMFFFFFFFLLI